MRVLRLRASLLTLALCAGAPAAGADGTVREHLIPDGPTETCQRLVPFPFTPQDVIDLRGHSYYRAEDFEDVDRLCAIDFHAEASNIATPVGICPKIHGTTPGLELYDLASARMSKRDFEAARCKIPGRKSGSKGKPRGAVKVAKYKTAVYINEPQAMLFYFHFSRLLGNLGHVQPATYRTVAAARLRRWSGDAIALLSSRQNQTFSPLDGWEVVHRLLDPRLKPRPRIVAARSKLMADADLVHGAIVENPRGERERRALCLRGKKSMAHPSGWKQTPFFRLVNSRRPLAEHRYELQTLACARDYIDMVILDHVFNQLDRMGNVHQKTYYHFIDERGRLAWSGKPKPNSVPLSRLVMKDNDDGLRWQWRSMMAAPSMVEDIRHMDPTVYARMQWLAGLLADPASEPAVKAWFVQSVHVSESHYAQVRARFIALAAGFKKRHDRGQLQLDLDLAAAVSSSTRRPPSAERSASVAPPAR